MLGSTDSCVQTISAKNASKATFILRDKIYTDKRKAALYETLANALDEHKKWNVQRPVDIYLSEIELCIRDYGAGLSDEDVMRIFFQYFESTKDQDNTFNGGFGIGAKAPGAYADVYHVESYFNGMRTIFSSVVNGLESHVHKMHSEPSTEPTGICVRIPINKSSASSYTSDRCEFLDLLHDAYVHVGVHHKECPFRVWSLKHRDLDYDACVDFIKKHNLTSSEFVGEKITRFADLITLDANGEPEPLVLAWHSKARAKNNQKAFIEAGIPVPMSPVTTDIEFKASFFNKQFFAHDGDFMYPISLKCYDIIEAICEANPELPYFSFFNRLYGYDTRVILFFNRDELPISPTRESIEITNSFKAVLTRKLEALMRSWLAKTNTMSSPSYWRKQNKDSSLSTLIRLSATLWSYYSGNYVRRPEDNKVDEADIITTNFSKEQLGYCNASQFNLAEHNDLTIASQKAISVAEWLRHGISQSGMRLLIVTHPDEGLMDSDHKVVNANSFAFREALEKVILDKISASTTSYSILYLPKFTGWNEVLRRIFTVNDTFLLGTQDILDWETDIFDVYLQVKAERAAKVAEAKKTTRVPGTSKQVCLSYFDYNGTVRELYEKGEKVIYYTTPPSSASADVSYQRLFDALSCLYGMEDGFHRYYWVSFNTLYCGLCTLLNVRGIIRHSNKSTYARLVNEVGEKNIINLNSFTQQQLIEFLDKRVCAFFKKHKLKIRHVPTPNCGGIAGKVLTFIEEKSLMNRNIQLPSEQNVISLPLHSDGYSTGRNDVRRRLLTGTIDDDIMHGPISAGDDTAALSISAAITALAYAMYVEFRYDSPYTNSTIYKLVRGDGNARYRSDQVWMGAINAYIVTKLEALFEKHGTKLDWLWCDTKENMLSSLPGNLYHSIKENVAARIKDEAIRQTNFMFKLWCGIKPMTVEQLLKQFDTRTKNEN